MLWSILTSAALFTATLAQPGEPAPLAGPSVREAAHSHHFGLGGELPQHFAERPVFKLHGHGSAELLVNLSFLFTAERRLAFLNALALLDQLFPAPSNHV